MNTNLFAEFPEISTQEWKLLIQSELKGADYNDTLVWESLEGIKIKPFYHPDEAEYLKIPDLPKNFNIAQSIYVDDESISNKIALEALQKGTEIVIFEAHQSFDMDVLLQGFEKERVNKIIFQFHFLSVEFIKNILQHYPKLPIAFSIDVIGNFTKTGNWFSKQDVDMQQLKDLVVQIPTIELITVQADVYQNAGANIIQQIAYALAHTLEYFEILNDQFKGKITVVFAVGSHFFFEIAKLRAFRYLWQEMQKATQKKSVQLEIVCRPTLRNKTLYDYNVNLLRTATEKFSAVLGGADVIQTLPYDIFFKKSNAFSERIARNQLLLLKNENELFDAAQIAEGSYYIENLTIEMVKKSLELFQNIEKNGGLIHQLNEGIIQRKIKESSDKEQQLFDEQKIVLIGSNKFPKNDEKLKNQIEIFPFTKKRNDKTTIKPILPVRLTEKLEQERLEKEV